MREWVTGSEAKLVVVAVKDLISEHKSSAQQKKKRRESFARLGKVVRVAFL